MSVAQTKSARRKMKLRYRGGQKHRSVAESIEVERRNAARAANMKSKKKG